MLNRMEKMIELGHCFSQALANQPTNEPIRKCTPTSDLLKTASSVQLAESHVPFFLMPGISLFVLKTQTLLQESNSIRACIPFSTIVLLLLHWHKFQRFVDYFLCNRHSFRGQG